MKWMVTQMEVRGIKGGNSLFPSFSAIVFRGNPGSPGWLTVALAAVVLTETSIVRSSCIFWAPKCQVLCQMLGLRHAEDVGKPVWHCVRIFSPVQYNIVLKPLDQDWVKSLEVLSTEKNIMLPQM